MLHASPNLAYLKAAWSALADISVSHAGKDQEELGLSLQRVNHSTLVRKNGVQVATMPLHYSRKELRVGFLGRIENEVRKAIAEIDHVLYHDLDVPPGHRLVMDMEEDMRMLRRQGNRMLSIRLLPDDGADPQHCAAAEMRIFLDAPRACLFAYRLDLEDGQHQDLLADLPKRARMPRAKSYAQLAQGIAQTLNAAWAQVV